jgi:hypothetical protein
MNLLCPNCQKMLTVPEEFAGQLMKCPLCGGNFTVPGLPGFAPPSPPSSEQEPDIYSIRHEPPPPAPPPLPELEPSLPPTTITPSLPPPTTPLPLDHQHTLAMSLNPIVLPWIAPVCLVLVFFLQFFDWDGVYPGGVPAVTGNAWYAAFGTYSVDGDLKDVVRFIGDEKHKPGVSVLTIFYLILFFPALIVSIASVVLPLLHIKLPPQVDKLMPWRWRIVAAVNLVLFFFLGLQVLLGFSLDSRYTDWVDQETKGEVKENPTTQEKKLADAHRGELLMRLRHTATLRLVVLLHLVATLSAILVLWIDRRGALRPSPKLELRW